MPSVPVRVAALAFAAVALAACGGNTPASAVPTIPALPSGAIPSIGVPSSIAPDASLESMYPDTIGGNAIEPTSATGEGVFALFGNTDPTEFNTFLAGIGANISQVSAAMSFNLWPGPTEGDFTGITIIAMRVQGVSSATTLAGFANLVKEDVPNATIGTQSISGKSVTAITNPENGEDNAYLYGVGDVVFMVGGTQAHVEEAFSKLP